MSLLAKNKIFFAVLLWRYLFWVEDLGNNLSTPQRQAHNVCDIPPSPDLNYGISLAIMLFVSKVQIFLWSSFWHGDSKDILEDYIMNFDLVFNIFP